MSKLPIFQLKITASNPSDTDILAVFHDSSKKAISPQAKSLGGYRGPIEKLKKSDSFQGRLGTVQYVRFGGRRGVHDLLTVGLGNSAELTDEKIRQAGGNVWNRLKAEKSRSATVQLDSIFETKGLKLSPHRIARALAEGLILSVYQFDKYKSKSPDSSDYSGPSKIFFVTKHKELKSALEAEIKAAHMIGDSVNLTRDWSNEPSNHGTPEYYATQALALAKSHGLKCRVLTEKDAEKEKMGLFLGVGQGGEREGKIVVVEYTPSGKNHKTLALVGKGVTFDSGGISIKPSMRMEEMKHDMTGAATVMGAVLLASKWKVPNRVIGIMAFTENMPDGNAIQPGNVLTARNGKTVEIINTDAEGRLILADVLDYAQDMKPDAVVNVATLTGAVTIALGKQCCAILGNNQELIDQVRGVGDKNGERIWQLPLFDEYFEDMKSDTADMKNSVNDSYGGTIRGAMFLKQFIRKETKWAHLDIAATAWGLTHLSYYPKRGASGSYVRTLAQLAAEL